MFEGKKLGFGLMRLPLTDANDKGSIDIEALKEMVDTFMEQGFTYFDTAWMYCAFKSENAVKEALTDRYPRDRYTLTTKLHASYLKTKEDRDRIFEEQRQKTGVDYFDYYLIHAIDQELYLIYNEMDCFNWLIEKKKQGFVKHIGFSYHDSAEFLDQVLTEHPEMEFVQLQMNYLDWESAEVQSRKCYEVASKHGKPVIVMEPVKGGTLADVPAEVRESFAAYHPDLSVPSWAIRFVASLDNVAMVLSGMSNMEQLMDNISYMKEFVPMNAEETELVHKAAEMIKDSIAIPCTGCSYCTEGCPMQIAIPDLFRVYNKSKRGEIADVEANEEYRQLTESGGKARECLACGQCQVACPQHLEIINYLKDVAKCMEKQD